MAKLAGKYASPEVVKNDILHILFGEDAIGRELPTEFATPYRAYCDAYTACEELEEVKEASDVELEAVSCLSADTRDALLSLNGMKAALFIEGFRNYKAQNPSLSDRVLSFHEGIEMDSIFSGTDRFKAIPRLLSVVTGVSKENVTGGRIALSEIGTPAWRSEVLAFADSVATSLLSQEKEDMALTPAGKLAMDFFRGTSVQFKGLDKRPAKGDFTSQSNQIRVTQEFDDAFKRWFPELDPGSTSLSGAEKKKFVEMLHVICTLLMCQSSISGLPQDYRGALRLEGAMYSPKDSLRFMQVDFEEGCIVFDAYSCAETYTNPIEMIGSGARVDVPWPKEENVPVADAMHTKIKVSIALDLSQKAVVVGLPGFDFDWVIAGRASDPKFTFIPENDFMADEFARWIDSSLYEKWPSVDFSQLTALFDEKTKRKIDEWMNAKKLFSAEKDQPLLEEMRVARIQKECRDKLFHELPLDEIFHALRTYNEKTSTARKKLLGWLQKKMAEYLESNWPMVASRELAVFERFLAAGFSLPVRELRKISEGFTGSVNRMGTFSENDSRLDMLSKSVQKEMSNVRDPLSIRLVRELAEQLGSFQFMVGRTLTEICKSYPEMRLEQLDNISKLVRSAELSRVPGGFKKTLLEQVQKGILSSVKKNWPTANIAALSKLNDVLAIRDQLKKDYQAVMQPKMTLGLLLRRIGEFFGFVKPAPKLPNSAHMMMLAKHPELLGKLGTKNVYRTVVNRFSPDERARFAEMIDQDVAYNILGEAFLKKMGDKDSTLLINTTLLGKKIDETEKALDAATEVVEVTTKKIGTEDESKVQELELELDSNGELVLGSEGTSEITDQALKEAEEASEAARKTTKTTIEETDALIQRVEEHLRENSLFKKLATEEVDNRKSVKLETTPDATNDGAEVKNTNSVVH